MTVVQERSRVYGERRRRALELAASSEYVAEPLRLYAALLDAQERAFERAREDRPTARELPGYVVRVALPGVMDATMVAGTELLREAALLRFHDGDLEDIVAAWLSDGELVATDRFLAHAAAAPVLEALPDVAASLRAADAADDRRCPACGGLPQLAMFAETGDALVTGQRRLLCSRCTTEWAFGRMTCASCRETDGGKMPILADESRLPHLRVDACDTCRAYLVTVDVRKDPRAVPIVDEIAALPLDLIATERGYTKIAPNVMGF